ncbi:hypothetical protein [Staphylococcus epidermidis]|uniref:hypothetical protein n=1 Tax=Staphylococcus epidermidis TaxID=1282 RepID=UPI001F3F3866|nr:hypothetical protein [Staphylococcus epidermidis]MCF7582751.1 hypothetical protein [Staphylococcus epidermidis]MCG1875865.1 hypothetical protein [Staphylococcus epidermidis]MCT2081103.1 hypothetical protein [Staphylococcus epidermidis]MCT2112295.1 hypothetical protein [Staphylococcus epidermidis]MCT2231157.1 hypothetical protein [Staphylococcus epidermidis]
MNNKYLMNHRDYKNILNQYNELVDAIKLARLRRTEASYVSEKANPKINELKQSLKSIVPAIQEELRDKMGALKKRQDANVDIDNERYKNDVEQSKIKLMNEKELIEYAKGLEKSEVTPQILSEVKAQSENLNMSDVLLEMRIEELKPYALYPHMRDDEYIELDNQLNYIKNIEDDLFNGTLYFEDGTTSNIDSALNEWINKNHYDDPQAKFQTKESWETFI